MTAYYRELASEDVPTLAGLLVDDGGYSQRVHGRAATDADAGDLLTERPPTLRADAKHVLGRFDGSNLVAVADVLRGYPSKEYAYIGLLQVAARFHGQGTGRALHDELMAMVRTWPEVTTVRLAVADANRENADPFWDRLGYVPTGEVTRWGGTFVRFWELPVC